MAFDATDPHQQAANALVAAALTALEGETPEEIGALVDEMAVAADSILDDRTLDIRKVAVALAFAVGEIVWQIADEENEPPLGWWRTWLAAGG